jgi:phosphotransferase system HPr (HPr) family protein
VSRREEVVVTNPTGLHARPAARFVELARGFESTVSIEKDGRQGNAKSLVSVLKLGINQGSLVALAAEGPDENRAVEALSELLRDLAETE